MPTTEQGDDIINDFLNSPANAKIPAWFRKAVKDHQWFMPRAATTSRELALEVLKTTQGNQFCIWHHVHDKGGKKHDSDDSSYKVTGTPFPRLSDKMLKKMTANDRTQLLAERKGVLSCGCPVDVALLDLYLWKTWTARSSSGEFEGLRNQRIDPRTRLFIAEAYKTHAGLTVDDLYTNGRDELHATKLRLHAQIVRLASEYDAIANFPGGRGLIVSVCEFHYVSLTTLTSIHTSSLVTLIAVMMVVRKMPVSHNFKLVYKPVMSYVVILSIPVWNIRMHNIHSYTGPTVSDIVTKFIYLFYFPFYLFSASCPLFIYLFYFLLVRYKYQVLKIVSDNKLFSILFTFCFFKILFQLHHPFLFENGVHKPY